MIIGNQTDQQKCAEFPALWSEVYSNGVEALWRDVLGL